jgi:hypothetical protein
MPFAPPPSNGHVVAAMRPLARRRRTATFTISLFSLGFAAILGLGGCGHPATADECRTIVDRIVELELKAQNVSDPAEVTRRRRTSLGMGDGTATPPDLVKDCVGRHLTDRAIACVRSAQTADEITERCLR